MYIHNIHTYSMNTLSCAMKNSPDEFVKICIRTLGCYYYIIPIVKRDTLLQLDNGIITIISLIDITKLDLSA